MPPSVDSRLTRHSYLILPGLYAREPELKVSQPVLSVIVVALLTAGYSFTALVCFACRNDLFQAERVFLYGFCAPLHLPSHPALTCSIGLPLLLPSSASLRLPTISSLLAATYGEQLP